MFESIGYGPCVLVIPARRRSQRLPGKMLLRETGRTVVQHTYEAACRAELPDAVVVATDDAEIADEARGFGAPVVMTNPDCPSGTDRVAEAVGKMPAAELVVNLQGDEPEIDPCAIDRLIESLRESPESSMATLAAPIRERAKLFDPSCVKVVFDESGKAIYFSRSPVPHPREWHDKLLTAEPPAFFQHIGVYAYRRELLLGLSKLPVGRLEKLEKLEQLRVLESGRTIEVVEIDHAVAGIDTPEDYAEFVERRRAG
ncbi:MAG: 3-deoxy-manno-octulosonate cytidylyltransferase [Planctomycetota bacterium]